ncbi:hypothetical protein Bhyg_11468, partial [Pseudolycoriella hygida]
FCIFFPDIEEKTSGSRDLTLFFKVTKYHEPYWFDLQLQKICKEIRNRRPGLFLCSIDEVTMKTNLQAVVAHMNVILRGRKLSGPTKGEPV